MAKIREVENYTLIIFEHSQSSAAIYLRRPQELALFQIDVLENFFKRIMYYIGLTTNIDIVIEQLPNDEVNVVAYLYNNQQDYDFCANFPRQFMAIHSALSSLFELSVSSRYNYDSVNTLTGNEEEDDYGDEYYKDGADREIDQAKEEGPNPQKSNSQGSDKPNEKLDRLGKIIDKMLKRQDKNWPAA